MSRHTASQAIYLNLESPISHNFQIKEGPTKKKLEDVLLLLEDGYVCGNSISEATGFYLRTAIQCGNYIESRYYNPSIGLKGGRIVTEDICAIRYDKDDILSSDFLQKHRETGGKNPVPICRFCFDNKLPVPTSGSQVNQQEKIQQERVKKKCKMKGAVEKGLRKGRK